MQYMQFYNEDNLDAGDINWQLMAGVTVDEKLKKLMSANARCHHIIRVPERPIARLAVYLLNISNSGAVAEYRVRIGEFRVYVKLLNLLLEPNSKNQHYINQGNFGQILEKSVATYKFVAKIQKKNINK
jgi:hypothetical protein